MTTVRWFVPDCGLFWSEAGNSKLSERALTQLSISGTNPSASVIMIGMHADEDGDANDVRFVPDLLPLIHAEIKGALGLAVALKIPS